VAGAKPRDHCDNGLDDVFWVARGSWNPVFGDDLARFADEGSGDLGSADVDSDGMHD
jgi:hypothetical protein